MALGCDDVSWNGLVPQREKDSRVLEPLELLFTESDLLPITSHHTVV